MTDDSNCDGRLSCLRGGSGGAVPSPADAMERARAIFQSDKPHGFVWNARLCKAVATALVAAEQAAYARAIEDAAQVAHSYCWMPGVEARMNNDAAKIEDEILYLKAITMIWKIRGLIILAAIFAPLWVPPVFHWITQ